MKVFDGRKAAEDYMAAHTLTFSTPDLTLKRFAFWLGDMVPGPGGKEDAVPRMYTYVEEKDFAPASIVDEDNYTPSGAVRQTALYGSAAAEPEGDAKFCPECGTRISRAAKFCTGCGTVQD